MFGAWHHLPPNSQYYYLLAVTQYFFKRRGSLSLSFSVSVSLHHSATKKKRVHLVAAKDEVTEVTVPTLPASQAASQTNTHTRSRTGHEYFSSVYYIQTPWRWGCWLHHGSSWPRWHTALIFLSRGISEWRHKTLHETLIHLSNVYFSTSGECTVTVQQRHVNAPPVVLKRQCPVSHLGMNSAW